MQRAGLELCFLLFLLLNKKEELNSFTGTESECRLQTALDKKQRSNKEVHKDTKYELIRTFCGVYTCGKSARGNLTLCAKNINHGEKKPSASAVPFNTLNESSPN